MTAATQLHAEGCGIADTCKTRASTHMRMHAIKICLALFSHF